MVIAQKAQTRNRRRVSSRHRLKAVMESLETRQMFSLLGIAVGTPFFSILAQNGDELQYASNELKINATTGSPFTVPPGLDVPPTTLQVDIHIDNGGNLIAGSGTNTDLVFSDSSANIQPLLTGKILNFGWEFSGPTLASFDFDFQVTGGSLAANFAGGDIGLLLHNEGVNLPTDFSFPFQTNAKGQLGAIPSGNPPINITGQKFTDITGDGFSNDDTPLAGVPINLYADTNTNGSFDGPGTDLLYASTVTQSPNGQFAFTNVPAGTYFVQEGNIPGYIQTGGGPNNGVYTVTGNSSINNFDNFKLIAISGKKYNDLNGDGSTLGDSGLAGITIDLFKNNGSSPFMTTVTGTDGTYTFTNLGPGSYTVQEELPGGSVQTLGNAGYTIPAKSGQDSNGNDFANFSKIKISGKKYTDITGNGITGDDTPLGGISIQLFKNNGSSPFMTTTTATDGTYSFVNLGPGNYIVKEVLPGGYTQTVGNSGYTIPAQSGSDSAGNNFANFKNMCISGKKFTDKCGDGFSPDDTPLGGVTIQLFKNGGSSPFMTTVTAADGSYSFNNLPPAVYTVNEVVPPGYVQTGGIGGYTLQPQSGANYTGKNFDNFAAGQISGHKYLDCCGDGLSSDDAALAGFTIQLYRDGNNNNVADASELIASKVTGADGAFSFTNLPAGKYIVKEVQQNGYLETWPVSGQYVINLSAGGNSTKNDFDNFKLDNCEIDCLYYVINGCKIVCSLGGNLHQGDTVKACFYLPEAEKISLVSYTAPDSYFVAEHASQQKIFDVDSQYFEAGWHCLTVTLPCCYYQIDLVCGCPIDQLGPAGSNIFYTPQQRLHDHDNGGTSSSCPTMVTCNGSGQLCGTVYNDCNNNGKKDTGEKCLSGIKITCVGTTNTGGCVLVHCVTDSSGNYKFCNLPAGTYKIIEHGPCDYADGKDSYGSCGGTSGDDFCSNIVLGSGKCGTGYNFGELNCAKISGCVYNDGNKNGKCDLTEKGCAGVKITCTGTNDLGQSITCVTYTDANGCYSFNGLRAGSYCITKSQPSGYYTTKNTCGTLGGTWSYDTCNYINTTWGSNGTGYNFGVC